MVRSLISALVRNFDHNLSKFLGFLFHPRNLSTFLHLTMAFCLRINMVLLCDSGLACRLFLPTKRLVNLVFQFGDLGFVVCDLGTVVCLFVRAQQDVFEVLEFGAGLLVLHEGGMLGGEGLGQACVT